MRYLTILPALALALWTAAPHTAAAQEPPEPDRPVRPQASGPPQRPLPHPGGRLADADTRELIETVRMVRLARELDLTQEQTVLMVRLFDNARKHMAELNRERQDLLRDLKEATRTDAAEETARAILERLIEQDKKIAQARFRIFDEAGKDLDARQQARLYVFLNEFDADMRRLIQGARESAGGDRIRQFREMRQRMQGDPPPGRPDALDRPQDGPPPALRDGRPRPQRPPRPAPVPPAP